MTPDEIKKVLEEAGIPVGGGWGPTRARTNIESPIVKRQKAALRKIESLLVQQVEQDKQKVADLHIALQRIKHGGGQ
jgi:hypothetical protein